MLPPVQVRLFRLVESHRDAAVARVAGIDQKLLECLQLLVVKDRSYPLPIHPEQCISIPGNPDQVTGIGVKIVILQFREILKQLSGEPLPGEPPVPPGKIGGIVYCC